MRSLFSKIFGSMIITITLVLIIVLGSMYISTRISTSKWHDTIIEEYTEIVTKNLAFAEEQETLGRTVIFEDIIINSIDDNRITGLTFYDTSGEQLFRWSRKNGDDPRTANEINLKAYDLPIEYLGEQMGVAKVLTISPNTYDITKDYINRLLFTLLISFVTSVLCSFILAYLLSKNIMTPITQISDSLSKLTEGINTAEINTKTDIKELYDISKAAERLQQEIISNERSRAAWLNNIGHDLNTPVTSLRVQIEGLCDHVFTPSDKIFNSMNDELVTLGNRISSFIDLAQLDSPDQKVNYTVVHSSELVDVLKYSFQDIKKTKDISVLQEIEKFDFSTDLSLITKAFGAILDNAFNYTPEGGDIHIYGKDVPEGILFTVENTGMISPEILPQIFHELIKDDFSRGKSGAGLGLSVVKRITTLLGGTVSIRNTEYNMVQCKVLLPKKA